MPYFVLARAGLLRGFGHAINFLKDAETWVPPMLVAEAVAIGATPVEGAAIDHVPLEKTEAPLPEYLTDEMLFEAFRTIEARGDDPAFREDFGANSMPTTKVLTQLLGQTVSSKSRTEAWLAYRAAKVAVL